MSIESNPIDLANRQVLPAPMIFEQNKVIHINDNVLRRLPIQKPVHLGKDEWIMIYQAPKQKNTNRRSNYVAANNIYNGMVESTGILNMRIEEPYWIELENEADMTRLEEELQFYILNGGQHRFPKLILMVLGNENLYKDVK